MMRHRADSVRPATASEQNASGQLNRRGATRVDRFWKSTLSGERVERRLAAILAADVAGYSRLMGLDEEGTLAALKGHRRAVPRSLNTAHC